MPRFTNRKMKNNYNIYSFSRNEIWRQIRFYDIILSTDFGREPSLDRWNKLSSDSFVLIDVEFPEHWRRGRFRVA